ncbi:TPA: hypothetical protein DD712_00140 [Candidatus Acetothermia bacterium]|nr:hypothetical protein [Candidatus Acetothermia bacterium]
MDSKKELSALIIIDMQRGFLEQGYPLYCGNEARRVIAPIRKLIERELKAGSGLFFTTDLHDPDDKEFEIFPAHCIRGSVEAQIIPELVGYTAAGIVIEKQRYSAFFATDLEEHLTDLKPQKLILCGVCTDICVLHTAADARNRDYPIEIFTDCVASFDQDAHRFALRHMKKILGVRISEKEKL